MRDCNGKILIDSLFFQWKPSIDFDVEDDSRDPPVGVKIENNGPGPAVIRSMAYYLDGKQVDSWFEAAEKEKLTTRNLIYFELENGDTFPAGKSYWLIKYKKSGKNNSEELDQFADLIDDHAAVLIEFCSLLGECWKKCSTKDRCTVR